MSVSECEFIAECCVDWPDSAMFPTDARRWIWRWLNLESEEGFIGEDGHRVGFAMIYHSPIVTMVHMLCVHPDYRGMGYASSMWRALKTELVSRGTTQIGFKALPGPISDLTGDRFEKVGEEMGQSGLPLVLGRVTADMEV